MIGNEHPNQTGGLVTRNYLQGMTTRPGLTGALWCGVGVAALLLSGCLGQCSCKYRRHRVACRPHCGQLVRQAPQLSQTETQSVESIYIGSPQQPAAQGLANSAVGDGAAPTVAERVADTPTDTSNLVQQPTAEPIVVEPIQVEQIQTRPAAQEEESTRRPARAQLGNSLSMVPYLLDSNWLARQLKQWQQAAQAAENELRVAANDSAQEIDEPVVEQPQSQNTKQPSVEHVARLPMDAKQVEPLLPGPYLTNSYDWQKPWRFESQPTKLLEPQAPAPIILRAIPLVAEPNPLPSLAEFRQSGQETASDKPGSDFFEPTQPERREQEVNRLRNNWR